jgi:hypothetical protein
VLTETLQKYAEITIDCNVLDQEELAALQSQQLRSGGRVQLTANFFGNRDNPLEKDG